MKAKKILLVISIVFVSSYAVRAQEPSQLNGQASKERFQSMSERETKIMKERYSLTAGQEVQIEKINDSFYLKLNLLIAIKEARQSKMQKIEELSREKDDQLKNVFTSIQYAAYKNDLTGMESRAEKIKKASEL